MGRKIHPERLALRPMNKFSAIEIDACIVIFFLNLDLVIRICVLVTEPIRFPNNKKRRDVKNDKSQDSRII